MELLVRPGTPLGFDHETCTRSGFGYGKFVSDPDMTVPLQTLITRCFIIRDFARLVPMGAEHIFTSGFNQLDSNAL